MLANGLATSAVLSTLIKEHLVKDGTCFLHCLSHVSLFGRPQPRYALLPKHAFTFLVLVY